MIIENRIGIKVIDLLDYTIGQINDIYDFYSSRGFDVYVE